MDTNKKTLSVNITGIWKVNDSNKAFQIEISQLPGVNLYQGKLIDYSKQGRDDINTTNHHNSLFTGRYILK